MYNDKTIIYHLLNAAVSRTSVNNVSNLCVDAPCEWTIRYCLRDLDLNEIQESLNENLKIHTIKTVSRKQNEFDADFVDISLYGEEETVEISLKPNLNRELVDFMLVLPYI